MNSHDHAAELVRAFFARSRRSRYLTLLGSGPEGRAKVRRVLPHLRDLDDRFRRRVPGDATTQNVLRLLRELGAPATCHVLAEQEDIDDRELPLERALDAVIGLGYGALVSCIPGRLAYFEGEEPNDRAVLVRPAVSDIVQG